MKYISCLLIAVLPFFSYAQQVSRIRVYNKVFTTYPFSDPDPVPDPAAAIYPYSHFDGYTNQPVQKEWKVIEMENDYIRVMVLPEIGGKIWSATEKKTGKEFIYYNHVVKFRDVAMRGPWTSGGIESNFGIIGHTPNCATPVDYTTLSRPDGSVSCVVGALDLLTRTPWRIDINLPADKAYFTTKSYWFNPSGTEQPYYHWMNAGIKAAGNLEFIYPGTGFIGHEGEMGEWPVNSKNNRNVSWYENNNFGGYKSYHVFGKYSNFFGGYWHNENYGVVRYSDHDDKPGKKLWIWGLSRQGMIWENLLTDKDGQYVEIQSGRLFNQSAAESALTPFKHRGFAPYASDTWTEYWYPVMATRGYVFANSTAALNVLQENGWLKIFLSPVQGLQDTLTVMQDGKLIYSKSVSLMPLQVFADSLKHVAPTGQLTVRLGRDKLSWTTGATSDNISRPSTLLPGFDNNSMYGLYLQGKNNIYFRQYAKAEEKLRACIEKEQGFAPALTDLAMLLYRKMNYEEALSSVKKALSINTYDPAANYYYGLINKKMGRLTDALDGFDIATQSEEYRTPAFTELAKCYFSAGSAANEKAIHYAQKALLYNQQNTDALQVLAVASRLQGNKEAAKEILNRIAQYDPINCFVKFESWLWQKTPEAREALTSTLQNEMPDQSYLELGLWYYSIGQKDDCIQALQVYPASAEINYWLAWLHRDSPAEKTYYDKAIATKGQTAFAFRQESALPLRYYTGHTADWQPLYMLALIEGGCGNLSAAAALLQKCGQQPDDANFYSARAKLQQEDASAVADIKKALLLNGQQWRFYKQLTELYNRQGNYAAALLAAGTSYQKNPGNYIMGMLFAKTSLLNKKYAAAAAVLDKIEVIPYEGATDGRRLYKETHLMLAVNAMQDKKYKTAVAEIGKALAWPERLGVGKPYQDDIDERLEQFLLYQCYTKLADKAKANGALQQIKMNKAMVYASNNAISEWAGGNAAALERLPAPAAADDNGRILAEWLKSR